MFQSSFKQIFAISQLVFGALAILMALLDSQLLRLTGHNLPGKTHTTPRFAQFAKITERLGYLFLLVLGIGYLVLGTNNLYVLGTAFETFYFVWMVSLILIMLARIGIVLFNRRKLA